MSTIWCTRDNAYYREVQRLSFVRTEFEADKTTQMCPKRSDYHARGNTVYDLNGLSNLAQAYSMHVSACVRVCVCVHCLCVSSVCLPACLPNLHTDILCVLEPRGPGQTDLSRNSH